MTLSRLGALLAVLALAGTANSALASDQSAPPDPGRNRPERVERFRDMGFGLFIHWGVDEPIGPVISHSLVDASDEYVRRFYGELPAAFHPRNFHPDDWAELARLAGIRYVVFTAKHHAGFCFFDTATTDLGVMHTPFKRDVTAEILAAFRRQGIAPGLYFSPDDFYWLHQHGIAINRQVPDVQPSRNPGLLAYDRAQVKELLTHYGKIDVMFFDGEAGNLRELAWDLQPDIVVTRGAMPTPELHTMDKPLDEAWESCITMSTAWQYQPTLDVYKSGADCISLLVQTRAEGGNLLLDVGPKADGELPIQQEDRLREIALWMFFNRDCIYRVRPWVISHEGNIWFTRKKDTHTLYAIVDRKGGWPYGVWQDVVIRSAKATPRTTVSVLGQNSRVLEYQPGVDPGVTWKQKSDGLHIRAMRTLRMRDNRNWPDPMVLQLNDVAPAFAPPAAVTIAPAWAGSAARLQGRLRSLGDAAELKVGFQYQDVTGEDTHVATPVWITVPAGYLTAPGDYAATLPGLVPGHRYVVRAFAAHPLANFYGDELEFQAH